MSDEHDRHVSAYYRIGRRAMTLCARGYWGISVEGKENLALARGCVLAPVHRSFIDFLVVAAMVPAGTKLNFMAKDSLWGWKPFGDFLSAAGCIPVHRGTPDRAAIRLSEEVLRRHEPLVVFPEGTRRSGERIGDMHDGAAFLALVCGVPIVPIGIAGSERALPVGSKIPRPVRMHVVVGPEIVPGDGLTERQTPEEASSRRTRPSRRAVGELTELLRAGIQDAYTRALTGLCRSGGDAPVSSDR